MKKILLVFILLFNLFAASNITSVEAASEIQKEPYETQVIGLDHTLVTSSMAYEGVFVSNPGLSSPQDIYIDSNDIVYIADKGNKRIYVYDSINKATSYVGEGVLSSPTGVTTDSDSNIYVADSENQEVYKFSTTGELLMTIKSPNIVGNQPLFGEESLFIPTKVAVDIRGNLYITSQGNANGIIQMDSDGQFVGYFGPNTINVTFALLFKRMFLSEEDREIYASLQPKVTSNITIDSKNTVYTVIEGETGLSLKKYNANGTNILAGTTVYSDTYQDIFVDSNGFIYTIDQSIDGVITILDSNGNLLFRFGNTQSGSMTTGHFDSASGIAVDSSGKIWTIDSGSNTITVFTRTEFANTVMNSLLNYNEGNYDRAEELYEEVIRLNSSFLQAYIGLGNIAQRNLDYELALEYFEIANYKTGYSDAFWELRNIWLTNNFVILFFAIVIAIILILIQKKKHLISFNNIKNSKVYKKIINSKLYYELKHLIRIFKTPNDVFYDIKYNKSIRYSTAIGLLAFFILLNIISDYYIMGYIFQAGNVSNMNFSVELLKYGLIILLFAIGNYLMSSLQNGEGFFRDIFIGTIVSFAPIILFKLPLDIFSNVLTYNESYIYTLSIAILWIWSIFNVILMLRQIHNFKIKALVVNIILTFLTMIIIILLYLIIVILFGQFSEFITGILKEVMM